MNFLKNHYEKVILALLVIALLASGTLAYLWTESAQKRIADTQRPPNVGKAEEKRQVDVAKILGRLDEQLTWQHNPRHAIFTPPFRAVEKNKKLEVTLQGGGAILAGPNTPEEKPAHRDKVELAARVIGVESKPFNLLFKGVMSGIDKNNQPINKFQISFLSSRETPIVPIGVTVKGFTIKKYREIVTPMGKDLSELDMQRGEEPVVTLIRNQVQTIGKEMEATIDDLVANKTLPTAKIDDKIVIEIEDPSAPMGTKPKHLKIELKVIDIKPTEVLLEEVGGAKAKYKFERGKQGVKIQ